MYLHYVLDQWFERDVKPRMQGEAYLIRFAQLAEGDLELVHRLKELVDGRKKYFQAMSASVLHPADPQWRPDRDRCSYLPGAYLSAVHWDGIDLNRVNLKRADLSRSNLRAANLKLARLGGNPRSPVSNSQQTFFKQFLFR